MVRRACFLLGLNLILATLPAAARTEPTLSISDGQKTRTFSRAELLRHPKLETLTVPKDPAYPGQTMTYQGVPAHELFEGLMIADDAVIQFRCLDGFAAPIAKERLLNRDPNQSRAYVAIEPAKTPWPKVKGKEETAGPFYLVWKEPERSFISQEEWPFQLVAFEVKGKLAELYPKIFPAEALAQDHPARRGLLVFVRNCFACHTMNKSGAGTIGPDLNLPMNPTEYLTPTALRTLIRDPQALRFFPNSRMSGFDERSLPQRELDDLIAYLKHMAGRKQP